MNANVSFQSSINAGCASLGPLTMMYRGAAAPAGAAKAK